MRKLQTVERFGVDGRTRRAFFGVFFVFFTIQVTHSNTFVCNYTFSGSLCSQANGLNSSWSSTPSGRLSAFPGLKDSEVKLSVVLAPCLSVYIWVSSSWNNAWSIFFFLTNNQPSKRWRPGHLCTSFAWRCFPLLEDSRQACSCRRCGGPWSHLRVPDLKVLLSKGGELFCFCFLKK